MVDEGPSGGAVSHVALRGVPSARVQLIENAFRRTADEAALADLRGRTCGHCIRGTRSQLPAILSAYIRSRSPARRLFDESPRRGCRRMEARQEFWRRSEGKASRCNLHCERRRGSRPLQPRATDRSEQLADIHRQVHLAGPFVERGGYKGEDFPLETSFRNRRDRRFFPSLQIGASSAPRRYFEDGLPSAVPNGPELRRP